MRIRNNKAFAMILAVIAIALAGAALVMLTQMSRDSLIDAKQAQKQADQRNELLGERALAEHFSKPPLKRK